LRPARRQRRNPKLRANPVEVRPFLRSMTEPKNSAPEGRGAQRNA
jgi:hypothetical protein